MTTVSQRSFTAGEVAPSLYERVDLVKYATGLRTCKNATVLRYGGVSNRAGTEFICEVSDSTKSVRLIPFIYNSDQTYVLEFGQNYMRVIKNGVQQKESAKTITGATQANPVVITSTSHGYSNGDEVYISGVVGMTELNGRNFKVNNVTANTFELQLMDGSTNLDGTGYTAYSSGGTAEKIYEITTNYTAPDLATVNFVQSADTITLVHPTYAPAEVTRTGGTAWAIADIDFKPTVARPTAIAATNGTAGAVVYKYKVTAIDRETGEESLVGTRTASATISGVTQADPAVVTATAHGFANGDEVYIESVVGMTELNDRTFIIDNVTANTFELENEDSTTYTAYSSGGTAKLTYATCTGGTPTTTNPNVISWTKATGDISEYNIYKESNEVYGLIGQSQGSSFNDINIDAQTNFTPPKSRNPFIGTGNYPSTVTYIQQRLSFANTDNDPEKVFMSRVANFKNFTRSQPSQDDDAITFTMAGRQVNEVRSLLDLGRFVILTSGGESSAEGDGGIIKPTAINVKKYSYNGSGNLQPIVIDGSAMYQQARGSIIRDLGYDFQIDGYRGNDLTLFSAHLFDKYTLVDWAYQQIPHSIVWVVRSDGVLLGMTYIKSQQVVAWHRHVFDGTAENVAVVPEGNEDVLYVTIRRTINSKVVRYVEKLSSRQINNILDNKFMDAFETYDGRNTGSTTMTLTGSGWTYTDTLTLTASASTFSSTDVDNAIHLRGASNELIRATITAYTSATVVSVRPHKTVPADLQATATTDWDFAVKEIPNLWHLEGETVAIFADGFVVGSPNNASYDTYTVANGKVTLDKPYAVVHVGIPYIMDIETLDIDTPNGETLTDKNQIVKGVTLTVEETRGLWVGAKPPTNDVLDPLEGLTEFKLRDEEDYDSPPSLTTDSIDVNIRPEWNSNGRVFIRQVDPIPASILSINPAGNFPFRGG